MNKICPYLAAGHLNNMSFNVNEMKNHLPAYLCVEERCAMWSTTMKACSQRGIFDNIERKAVEVTKEILCTMLDEKGGLGQFRREGPAD